MSEKTSSCSKKRHELRCENWLGRLWRKHLLRRCALGDGETFSCIFHSASSWARRYHTPNSAAPAISASAGTSTGEQSLVAQAGAARNIHRARGAHAARCVVCNLDPCRRGGTRPRHRQGPASPRHCAAEKSYAESKRCNRTVALCAAPWHCRAVTLIRTGESCT